MAGYTPANEVAIQYLRDTAAALNGNPTGYGYNYISTATTTVVKSGAGVIKSIIVEGGTAGAITLYDNTAGSGNVIANFDSTNALASYLAETAFNTGLTIVTAAATKLTVMFK